MALHFEGSLTIAASRDKVWSFVTDPHAVSKCLPDVKSLEVLDGGKFKAVVRVGVSFIKGNFTFDIAMLDLDVRRHARITGHGGGLGSAVDVDSTIELSDGERNLTSLTWKADVVVSGTIASVGARLLNSTVEKKTAELFACMKTQLEA
jgi:carbon monoxide dehydrogenase subunit G